MKVNFKLVGVDCAVCASKLEDAINKLPYIKSAKSSSPIPPIISSWFSSLGT